MTYLGLRPGEKLYEELLVKTEELDKTEKRYENRCNIRSWCKIPYKNIIIKHYALSMSGSEIARQTGFSKPSVNDFLRAFKKCEDLNYPLPAGITNYGNALKVYALLYPNKLEVVNPRK